MVDCQGIQREGPGGTAFKGTEILSLSWFLGGWGDFKDNLGAFIGHWRPQMAPGALPVAATGYYIGQELPNFVDFQLDFFFFSYNKN